MSGGRRVPLKVCYFGRFCHTAVVFVKVITKKQEQAIHESSPTEQLVLVIPAPSSDWREPFIKYLTVANVPANKTKMERLIRCSKHYVLVDGNLMRKNAKEE